MDFRFSKYVNPQKFLDSNNKKFELVYDFGPNNQEDETNAMKYCIENNLNVVHYPAKHQIIVFTSPNQTEQYITKLESEKQIEKQTEQIEEKKFMSYINKNPNEFPIQKVQLFHRKNWEKILFTFGHQCIHLLCCDLNNLESTTLKLNFSCEFIELLSWLNLTFKRLDNGLIVIYPCGDLTRFFKFQNVETFPPYSKCIKKKEIQENIEEFDIFYEKVNNVRSNNLFSSKHDVQEKKLEHPVTLEIFEFGYNLKIKKTQTTTNELIKLLNEKVHACSSVYLGFVFQLEYSLDVLKIFEEIQKEKEKEIENGRLTVYLRSNPQKITFYLIHDDYGRYFKISKVDRAIEEYNAKENQKTV